MALPAGLGCREAAPPSLPSPGKGSPLPAKLSPKERKAVELAQAFLARNGTAWGEPWEVEQLAEDEQTPVGAGRDSYRVIYPTPMREVRLLSHRAVLVNAKTGKAAFQPRE